MEMEMTISGKGYVFRGQTPGVAGQGFSSLAASPFLPLYAHA